MQPKKKLVDIIIPTFNGKDLLAGCLHSLQLSHFSDYTVTVIDDASTDNTKEFIKKEFNWVNLIVNRFNYGPAAAKNIGIKATRNEFILTLDNDTILTPDTLEILIEEMLKPENLSLIGACMPKILLAEEGLNLTRNFGSKTKIASAGVIISYLGYGADRGFGEPDAGQYNQKEYLLASTSSCCLYRRSVLEKIGLFDEKFFYPLEDVDLGWRMNLYGYKILYCPQAIVFHKYGSTMGRSYLANLYEIEKNRLRMVLKNYQFSTFVRFSLFFLVRHLTLLGAGIKRGIIKTDPKRPWKFFVDILKGLCWNFIMLPDTIAARVQIQKNRKISDKKLFKFFSLRDYIKYN